VEIHTQEIQELNLKSIVNFLKLEENVRGFWCGYRHAWRNATKQLDRIAYVHVKNIGDNLDKFVNKFINRKEGELLR